MRASPKSLGPQSRSQFKVKGKIKVFSYTLTKPCAWHTTYYVAQEKQGKGQGHNSSLR